MHTEPAKSDHVGATPSGSSLSDGQRIVVDGLRRDGLAVVRFADLFSEALWKELQVDISGFVEATERAVGEKPEQPKKKNDYIIRRFLDLTSKENREVPVLPLDSPWLRLAISDTMLDVVNAYRERRMKLCYVDNWYTVPYPQSEKRIASQRWHRDSQEEHVVKVFLYFSSVDDEAGPFEFVPGSPAGGRYGELWPWREGVWYPPPDEFDQAVPSEARRSLTGPPGTMVFCDTGGFHRGGFARGAPRIVGVWSYVETDEGKHAERVEFDLTGGTLTDQARYALS